MQGFQLLDRFDHNSTTPHYYVQCTGTLLPLGTTVPLLLLLMHTVWVQRLPRPVQAHYFHIAKLCPCYFYYYIKWQNTVWVLQHSTITGTTSTVLLLLYYIQPPTGHTWHRSTHFPIIHFWFNLLSFSLGPQLKPVSYDFRFQLWKKYLSKLKNKIPKPVGGVCTGQDWYSQGPLVNRFF